MVKSPSKPTIAYYCWLNHHEIPLNHHQLLKHQWWNPLSPRQMVTARAFTPLQSSVTRQVNVAQCRAMRGPGTSWHFMCDSVFVWQLPYFLSSVFGRWQWCFSWQWQGTLDLSIVKSLDVMTSWWLLKLMLPLDEIWVPAKYGDNLINIDDVFICLGAYAGIPTFISWGCSQ